MLMKCLALLAFAAVVAQASDVSPVEKVVTMLEDLQKQVVVEGQLESKTYDKYACFCKSGSEEKNQAITDGEDAQATYEGNLGTLTSARDDLDKDIVDLNADIVRLNEELSKAKAQRKKDESDYVVEEAEIDHANNCVKGAVDMLNAQKEAFQAADGASFLQENEDDFSKAIQLAADMADKRGDASAKKRKVLSAILLADHPLALLQQDARARAHQEQPDQEETEFASGEIIGVVEDLEDDFGETLTDVRDTEQTAATDHRDLIDRKTSELEQAETDLKDKQADRAGKIKDIGTNSKDLTLTTATLADDKSYLLDLTEKCNLKSAQWDQRSTMRTEELTALSTAINIVKGKVSEKHGDKTVRLVQVPQRHASEDSFNAAANKKEVDEILGSEYESFLQVSQTPRSKAHNLAAIARAARASKFLGLPTMEEASETRAKAISLLKSRAQQLNSPALIKLVEAVSADPFAKLKTLIQELVERLLQEAADEASHKGWCDKEQGKAKQSRKTKSEDVKRLNDDLSVAESKRDKLTEDIATLTTEIADLNGQLSKNSKERDDESTENSATVSEAEEGKEAVDEAIQVLERFYKTAAKAEEATAALLVKEQMLRLSGSKPKVGSDEPDAGFDSSYKGSQGASAGILGMLAVIQSDFVRTIETTKSEEKDSAAQYLEFETATKVSIGKKTAGKENRETELQETRSQILQDNDSLRDQQELLDKAIQEIQELHPQCSPAGAEMSYEDRVAKREQEIEAMKQALCVLGQEGPVQTEAGC